MKTMTQPEFIEGYRPGYLGRIAEMHGVYYAKVWGSGAEFEGMMAEEMREFLAEYQEGRDFMLTAHVDGKLVGSIFIDGSERERPGGRLRWVIVDEAYHGQGIGRMMMSRTLDFARQAGFRTLYLWTVEGLPESRTMYERAGFEIVDRFPDDRYSVPRMNLLMEKTL